MGTRFCHRRKEIRYYKVNWYGDIPLLLQHWIIQNEKIKTI